MGKRRLWRSVPGAVVLGAIGGSLGMLAIWFATAQLGILDGPVWENIGSPVGSVIGCAIGAGIAAYDRSSMS